MVDSALIYRKLSDLDQYLLQISEFESVTARQYSAEWKTQRIIERTLQMMIECCTDIANHLISDLQLRSPETYAEAFLILSEHGVIQRELSAQLERMARFRNLIVHQYQVINAEIVVSILRERLVDFQLFGEQVLAFMRGRQSI